MTRTRDLQILPYHCHWPIVLFRMSQTGWTPRTYLPVNHILPEAYLIWPFSLRAGHHFTVWPAESYVIQISLISTRIFTPCLIGYHHLPHLSHNSYSSTAFLRLNLLWGWWSPCDLLHDFKCFDYQVTKFPLPKTSSGGCLARHSGCDQKKPSLRGWTLGLRKEGAEGV